MQLPQVLAIKISFSNTLESWLAGLGLGFFCLGIASLVFFFRSHEAIFYEGIYIDNHPVGGLTIDQARAALTQDDDFSRAQVTLSVDDISVASSAAEIGISRNYDQVLAKAFAYGHSEWTWERLVRLAKLQVTPKHYTTELTASTSGIKQLATLLASRVNIEGKAPAATLAYSGSPGSLTIERGQPGRSVKEDEVISAFWKKLGDNSANIYLEAPVASTSTVLTDEEMALAQKRATSLIGEELRFAAADVKLRLNDQDILALLNFPVGYNQVAIAEQVAAWATRVNREPQNPTFSYDKETLEVSEFKPPQDGLTLDHQQTQTILTTALEGLEKRVVEPSPTQVALAEAETTPPRVLPTQIKAPQTSLESLNDLGIKELIGRGESEYAHSIPSRIHNVKLTTDRISNTLIAPGQEFRFNTVLGEVSRRTGFQPAYVISGGRTILGDGGGVCQVSTTVFRAVLDAGLKVTLRRPHSYRVSYYELNAKPGIDATVYAGDIDFRFINDTDHYILIHAEADSENLAMFVDIYGTSDGRQTEIVDHKVWDFRSAPPSVYYDDPSIPRGVVKQVDWAVSGVKASFKNVIRDKNGTLLREDEYYSNYVPWSAKYARGV